VVLYSFSPVPEPSPCVPARFRGVRCVRPVAASLRGPDGVVRGGPSVRGHHPKPSARISRRTRWRSIFQRSSGPAGSRRERDPGGQRPVGQFERAGIGGPAEQLPPARSSPTPVRTHCSGRRHEAPAGDSRRRQRLGRQRELGHQFSRLVIRPAVLVGRCVTRISASGTFISGGIRGSASGPAHGHVDGRGERRRRERKRSSTYTANRRPVGVAARNTTGEVGGDVFDVVVRQCSAFGSHRWQSDGGRPTDSPVTDRTMRVCPDCDRWRRWAARSRPRALPAVTSQTPGSRRARWPARGRPARSPRR